MTFAYSRAVTGPWRLARIAFRPAPDLSCLKKSSLFRQGCMYYQAIPIMKEERPRPLVERFAERLHCHRVFQETLGFI